MKLKNNFDSLKWWQGIILIPYLLWAYIKSIFKREGRDG